MASDDLAKLGWITDRLPTASDADREGDVKIPMTNNQGPHIDWRYQRWDVIVPGQPWWSQKAAAAAAAAEAAEAAASETGSAELTERAMTTHQLVYRLNAVNQELARRVREGLI